MCCLFGILDYQGRLSLARRRQMLAVLSRECEARGTDAAGIAYCVNHHLSVYKALKPAHLVNFQPPAQARFIMGHTRMATQGDEHCNYNNHPFKGRAGNTSFVLAHNGVLHNDQLLKVQYQLPRPKSSQTVWNLSAYLNEFCFRFIRRHFVTDFYDHLVAAMLAPPLAE